MDKFTQEITMIREGMADFETRILFLENSLPFTKDKPKPEVLPEQKWAQTQWDALQQIRSEVVGWRKQHAELLLALDKLNIRLDKKKKYKTYD